MSLAAFNQYKLQIGRGTCDLALIDAAERKKYVTAQEATNLRAIYHDTYDVRGLVAEVSDAREVVTHWSNPTVSATTNVATASVRVTRSVAGQESTANVNAANLGYTFPADLPPEAGEVLVTAVVVAPNGYEGPASTAETFVPEAPPAPAEPEPTPETPAEDPVAGEDEPATEEPPTGG